MGNCQALVNKDEQSNYETTSGDVSKCPYHQQLKQQQQYYGENNNDEANQQQNDYYNENSAEQPQEIEDEDNTNRYLERSHTKSLMKQTAPSFTCTAYYDHGFKQLSLEDYRGKFIIFYFYPYDFNPICTRELLALGDFLEKFKEINCFVLACSPDSQFVHMQYNQKPRDQEGLGDLNIPLIGDRDKRIFREFNLDFDDMGSESSNFRTIYIIDDRGVVRQLQKNDLPVIFNVEEVWRMVKNLQKQDESTQDMYSHQQSMVGNSQYCIRESLFNQIGGAEVLERVIQTFFENVLIDDILSPFFQNSNMKELKSKMVKFLSSIFSSPDDYKGKTLSQIHQKYKLNDMHFNQMATHLMNAFTQHGTYTSSLREISTYIEDWRKECVYKVPFYEKIGGRAFLVKAMQKFYQQQQKDSIVKSVYQNVDMFNLQLQQCDFIEQLLGGPKNYKGKSIQQAHQHLNITNMQFDVTMVNFSNTLTELGLEFGDVYYIVQHLQNFRKDCVAEHLQENTLYTKLGGIDFLKNFVEQFFIAVLEDKKINIFFVNTDMQHLKDSFKLCLIRLFGGPYKLNDKAKTIQDIHWPLKLNDLHFNVFIDIFMNTLKSYNLPETLCEQVLSILESHRRQCVRKKDTLFQRLGGDQLIEKVVSLFIDHCLQEQKIKTFFQMSDPSSLKHKLTSYLGSLFSGPNEYQGKTIREAHWHFGLTDIHFELFTDMLINTFKSQEIDSLTLQEIKDLLEPLRKECVSEKIQHQPRRSMTLRLYNPPVHLRVQDKMLEAGVNKFWDRVLRDEGLKEYFRGIDQVKQKKMQRMWLTMGTAASRKYFEGDLGKVHQGMNIKQEHFLKMLEHCRKTLQDCEMDYGILDEIMVKLQKCEKQIVYQKKKDPLVTRLKGEENLIYIQNQFSDKILKEEAFKKSLSIMISNKEEQFKKMILKILEVQLDEQYSLLLKQIHEKYEIEEEQYDQIKGIIIELLREKQVEDAEIEDITEQLEKMKKYIAKPKPSVFEILGGNKGIEVAVTKFYDKVIRDNRIKHFFGGIDMSKQRKLQTTFLTLVIGGPDSYKGRDMRSSHDHMNLNDLHLNAFIELMDETLNELGVSPAINSAICNILEGFRKDLVLSKLSLYDKLGGEKRITQVVDKFYHKVMQNRKINYFFKAINMEKQKEMQKYFITMITGGPPKYKGKSIKLAHQSLNINDMHFNVLKDLLCETLIEYKVDEQSLKQMNKVIETLRKDIVTVKVPLIERIGGEKIVENFVQTFFEKINQQKLLKDKFKQCDTNKVKELFKLFIIKISGGPNRYRGRTMKEAHWHLKLTDMHFNLMKECLQEALEIHDIDSGTTTDLINIFETYRKDCISIQTSIIDRIGGEQKMPLIIKNFFDKVLVDKRLKEFFKCLDMYKQRETFRVYCVHMFGGPNRYKGKGIRESHWPLKLNDIQFSSFKDHMLTTLEEAECDPGIIADVNEKFEVLRRDCVSSKLQLFDKLGGDKAVEASVNKFYAKVLEDNRVKDFFKNQDISKQRVMQRMFLTMAFGGPSRYTGKSIKEVHWGLRLTDQHFYTIKDLLLQSLRELGADAASINEVSNLLQQMRVDIVSVHTTLFERLGGDQALEIIVNRFYQKVLQDQRVNSFFANVDMERQRSMQKYMLTLITGGNKMYKGRGVREAHANLGIHDTHFNIIKELLIVTLREQGADPGSIGEMANIIEGQRQDIVTKTVSLYERIGGSAQIEQLVKKFFDRNQTDTRIRLLFKKADMNRLKELFRQFLCKQFGGPQKFDGRNLGEAHVKLDLQTNHFQAFMSNLSMTFRDVGIDTYTTEEAIAYIEGFRGEVFKKPHQLI